MPCRYPIAFLTFLVLLRPAATHGSELSSSHHFGLYVSLLAGHSLTSEMDPWPDDVSFSAPTAYPSGSFAGARIGYDLRMNMMTAGVVADYSFATLSDRKDDGDFIDQFSYLDGVGTVRGKIGYPIGSFLPYVTGGMAFADLSYRERCPSGAMAGVCLDNAYDVSDQTWGFGPAISLGASWAISDRWFIGGEYQHMWFGEVWFDIWQGTNAPLPRAVDTEIGALTRTWIPVLEDLNR